LANFEVDPTLTVSTRNLVLLSDFEDILRVGHWGIDVEVLEVNGAEARAFAREHKVE